jgi:gliding motility-associated-like protein
LIIKDQFDCAASGNWHTIRNGTKNYTPPAYAAQTIFRNTAATVSVQNFQPGTYQLFQNSMGGTPLQQNETGVFTTGNLPADTTFYIRIKTGSCESGLTPVVIKVVDDTKVFVPTGFTPNKDGKNDDIKPLVLGLFTLEYFTVYDRWGRIVFTSGDLSKGWNGFIKGSEAPIGVYVWLLKGKDFRGNTIQQKGSFTLLR